MATRCEAKLRNGLILANNYVHCEALERKTLLVEDWTPSGCANLSRSE